MSNLLPSGSITGPPALLAVGIAVTSVLALAAAGWISRRRTARSPHRPGSPAVKVAAIAALGCTAYSADTSWRFAADYLDGTMARRGLPAAQAQDTGVVPIPDQLADRSGARRP